MKYEPMQEDAGSGRVFQKASKDLRPGGDWTGQSADPLIPEREKRESFKTKALSGTGTRAEPIAEPELFRDRNPAG